jgi:CheY-like chemotaxis protein
MRLPGRQGQPWRLLKELGAKTGKFGVADRPCSHRYETGAECREACRVRSGTEKPALGKAQAQEGPILMLKLPAAIFVVEDEVLIRMMLIDMIEELGHRVVAEAGNVRDAQALAKTAIFDLAILDVNIAGHDISPVAEILDKRGLPFVFVTGYGQGGQPKEFSERPVLPKPVVIAQLREAINSILGR